MLRYLKKYWYFAIFAEVFMVAEVYVDLYQPKMMAVIVDEGILEPESKLKKRKYKIKKLKDGL